MKISHRSQLDEMLKWNDFGLDDYENLEDPATLLDLSSSTTFPTKTFQDF